MSEYPQSPSNQSPSHEDEIDLREHIKVLWQGKLWIIGTTFIAAVISVAIALSLPNIYRAEALLQADEGLGALSSLANQYGNLASLAGVPLPDVTASDKKAIGIAILQSRQFLTNFMGRHNIIPELMAVSAYNVNTGELSYDPTIFDPETRIWTRDVAPPLQKKPSSQEAFLYMREILSVTEDRLTGFVTVSIEHLSPLIAYEWVTWLVDDLNRDMLLEATVEAQQSIDYLTNQLENTQVVALEQVFYALIEEQTKTLMLANSRAEYLFKTIDPAITPEIKSGPSRTLIFTLGTLLGGMLGVLWVLIRQYAFGSEADT
jgi:LPS O-antigen subunit length determinant protein (WzzB/FepE family)